jgi:hypothetical protein
MPDRPGSGRVGQSPHKTIPDNGTNTSGAGKPGCILQKWNADKPVECAKTDSRKKKQQLQKGGSAIRRLH